jgi:hypothetical protein
MTAPRQVVILLIARSLHGALFWMFDYAEVLGIAAKCQYHVHDNPRFASGLWRK